MNARLLALLPLLLLLLVLPGRAAPDQAQPVTKAGEELARRLDALDVERRWLPGRQPVDWRTGETTGPEKYERRHTRCSQFAAAACMRLEVYLLRPPEHSTYLLANAQKAWLDSEKGREAGWRPLGSPVEAQALANQGWLVVASYANPEPHRPGHIALVRPEARTPGQIAREGPAITQAGRENHRRTTAAVGFRNHPGAFERGEIHYFAHAVPGLTSSPEEARFRQSAEQFLEEYLALFPESATALGDHRHDARLTDWSEAGRTRMRDFHGRWLAEIATFDRSALGEEDLVDLEAWRTNLEAALFSLDQLRDWRWNPLEYNVGDALYPLMARDYAPLERRMESLRGRLEAVPTWLEAARQNLQDPPRIHVETAIQQNAGTLSLLGPELEALLEDAPELKARLAPSRERAVAAVRAYGTWLEQDLLPRSKGEFRLGRELWERKLAYTLESDLAPAQIQSRARVELAAAQEEMASVARPLFEKYFPGRPVPGERRALIRAVLDRLAQDRPDDRTILEKARRTVERATAFVRERELVTLPDQPLDLIEMPEFARGVAVAYCDSPGPLEQGGRTFYAISPAPADWSRARVESLYREYNDSMLEDLTVHEAMPGHYLQIWHSNRFQAPTRLRAVFSSGTFVEGWATYAEQVMAAEGFGGPEVRMQQLKMRLRLVLNAMLDQGVHADGMTREEAMRLMQEEGFQEEGEAAGKWRRACLTSTQLSTYFVGNLEVNNLSRRLRARTPGLSTKELHDAMLSFGSPAPRAVARLLGLEAPAQAP